MTASKLALLITLLCGALLAAASSPRSPLPAELDEATNQQVRAAAGGFTGGAAMHFDTVDSLAVRDVFHPDLDSPYNVRSELTDFYCFTVDVGGMEGGQPKAVSHEWLAIKSARTGGEWTLLPRGIAGYIGSWDSLCDSAKGQAGA